MVLLQGPPEEEEDQGATVSTLSLSDVGIEVKMESECKRVSSATRSKIVESRPGT